MESDLDLCFSREVYFVTPDPKGHLLIFAVSFACHDHACQGSCSLFYDVPDTPTTENYLVQNVSGAKTERF